MSEPTLREQHIMALGALVARHMARVYWLQTEGANLEVAIPDERNRLIFEAHLLGTSYEAIGEALHMTRERIRQIDYKTGQSLKDILEVHPIP